jgi:hypothetical protein
MSIDEALVYNSSGPILYSKTPKELEKYIDSPPVINVEFKWPDSDFAFENNYAKILTAAQGNGQRNRLIVKIINLMNTLGRTTITPVPRLEYGIHLMNLIPFDGVVCWFGGGNIFNKYRKVPEQELIYGLDNGAVKHLIVTSHADEGLNLPELSTTILIEGSGGRRSKQRSGRAARIGDRKSLVINIMDEGQGILSKHAKDRAWAVKNYYETEMIDTDIDHLLEVVHRIESESESDV